jgi:hypothetical protein
MIKFDCKSEWEKIAIKAQKSIEKSVLIDFGISSDVIDSYFDSVSDAEFLERFKMAN